MTKRYFVFIAGLHGPEGQILNEMPMTGEGRKNIHYLFGPIEINNETLDECIANFKDNINAPLSN